MPERRVYKYGTGQSIPEGAVYCSTVTQTMVWIEQSPRADGHWESCWLVWHYFLVGAREEANPDAEEKPDWFKAGFDSEAEFLAIPIREEANPDAD